MEGDKGGLAGLAGSLTMPLGHSFGIQLDGAFARVGEGNFGSAGAHVFWRDPTVGLIGFYGGAARLDRYGGQELVRLGGEAQRFLGQVTIDAGLGYRFGDNFVKDDVYGRARVQYYPTNNLMLSGGYSYEGRGFGTVGVEQQLGSGPSGGFAL